MLIATFGPSTGWAGKRISFEDDVFVLEGYGPLSPTDVTEYDRQGHLIWANDATRAWLSSLAQPESTAAVTTTQSSALAQDDAQPHPRAKAQQTSRRIRVSPLSLAIAGGSLVVVAVVLTLAFSGVFRGRGEPARGPSQPAVAQATVSATPIGATAWPTALAGTWLNSSGSEPAEIIIGESGGEATLTRTAIDGRSSSWIFSGDYLTITETGEVSTVQERQSPPSELYTGTYLWSEGDQSMTIIVSLSGGTLTFTASDNFGFIAEETFTISPDGQMLTYYDSGTDETVTFTPESV
jgi:hypothetical protein